MREQAFKIKEKMLELTQLFSIERNVFQRFVIIYKYIGYLNADPLVKNILQKIFNDTAKVMGEPEENMDEEKFLDVKGEAIYSKGFWQYYTNLEVIYSKMKRMKNCHLEDKADFDNLKKLFSKPYSKKMFELSFEVINSEVFNRLDQECFFDADEPDNKTYFDERKSILFVKGEKIAINKQAKITNAHKILKYIFVANKDNLTDDFFYSEIAEDEFEDTEYTLDDNSWRKYHTACQVINKKVEQHTKDEIKDFFVFNTGKKGKLKLNKNYL